MKQLAPQTVIFIGPQGSGKGTQISRLSDSLRIADPACRVADVQSGRRFRSFAQIESGYTADRIAETLDTGVLQPLFLSVTLWGQDMVQLVDPDCHVLIDGFPRAVPEAIVLDTAFEFYRRDHVSVVFLDTPEDIVRERMMARKRPDDTPESIEERLRWYREKTLPVVEFYRNRPHTSLIRVDGASDVDTVARAIAEQLGVSADA